MRRIALNAVKSRSRDSLAKFVCKNDFRGREYRMQREGTLDCLSARSQDRVPRDHDDAVRKMHQMTSTMVEQIEAKLCEVAHICEMRCLRVQTLRALDRVKQRMLDGVDNSYPESERKVFEPRQTLKASVRAGLGRLDDMRNGHECPKHNQIRCALTRSLRVAASALRSFDSAVNTRNSRTPRWSSRMKFFVCPMDPTARCKSDRNLFSVA